jgi:drug/metabolite transporter (DMT)-like permease
MLLGILAGLATCALWGLTFIAPRAVEPFTAWDLAAARYGVFGLVSLMLMAHPRFRPRGLSRAQIACGLSLGGIGYVGYFVSTAYAVRLAGAAIPPVVIGTMPVLLALAGNWRDRSIPWSNLAAPLLLITAGVLTFNLGVLGASVPGEQGAIMAGTFFAVLALVIWIAYGLANAAVMSSRNAPDGLAWTGVQGVGSAIVSLLLLPLTSLGEADGFSQAETARFLGWALVMGLAGSWLATWCWVIASRRLALAFAAQLIVAETMFGLVYGFLFEARWPRPAEWTGCMLQLAGVGLAVAVFSGQARRTRRQTAR